MYKDALAVMVRVPVEGTVKTRLSPQLSASDACLLYEAFLKDLFARLASLENIDIHVFYAVPDEPLAPANKLGPVLTAISKLYPLTLQKDGDLGIKMKGAFDDLFTRGYERVALIGSDSPDIPLANITEAFTALKSRGAAIDAPYQLVLGPALDGGYYLIAFAALSASLSARLFTGIEWGTSVVFRRTLERVEQCSIRVFQLPHWHDIDSFEDISLLKDAEELPATRIVLNALNINS